MEVLGVRFVGVNAETGYKLLLSVVFIAGILLVRALLTRLLMVMRGLDRSERAAFWGRQTLSIVIALLMVMALVSIWFDDPQRLTTGLGLMGAGLAFALQRVITALAGYLLIMRGNTFTVGERIKMGGVRGDVIALSFLQTKILEMGQPPSVQTEDPAMWVRSRQFTGRIVTVTNDKVFDEPVFNYTRDFPFIWEEMRVPVPYTADRHKAEAILLDCVRRQTESIDQTSQPVRRQIEQRYGITLEDLTPRVFYRLTDNWLELTIRFIVEEHGIRHVKDAIARSVLDAFERAGIPVASATFEIVGVPPLRLAPAFAGTAPAAPADTSGDQTHGHTPEYRR
jgi:small-conductance mechanosensitive channel